MTNQTETTTKKLPTHIVDVVCYDQLDGKPTRHQIGAGWEHKDNNGVKIIVNGSHYVVRKAKRKPGAIKSKNSPTHYISVVSYNKNQVEPKWYRVGAGWEQKDTNELNLHINGSHLIAYKVTPRPA